MNMTISSKVALKILLSVNIILLCGFAFTIMFILLDASPGELYGRIYYATYNIQPLIMYSWLMSLVLSPGLAMTLALCSGYEAKKTFQWKINIALMVFSGLPSVALLGIGFIMRGI
jgi:hypothetical protein